MAVLRPALLFRFVWVIYLRYNLAEKEQKYTKFYKKKRIKWNVVLQLLVFIYDVWMMKNRIVYFVFRLERKAWRPFFWPCWNRNTLWSFVCFSKWRALLSIYRIFIATRIFVNVFRLWLHCGNKWNKTSVQFNLL